MNLFGFYFAYPMFLILLIAVPLMLWWFVNNEFRYFLQLRLSDTAFLPKEGWKEKGRYSIQVLQLLALVGVIIAMARPQNISEKEQVKGEGIDIVLAMDVSVSMLAKDFQPDRLEASKKVAATFVNGRKYDRIGLVVFAGESYTQCPLTTDHNVLLSFLSSIQCGLVENGTAIGMGLANALNRLNEQDTKSKVIILLTDGMNNSNYITPSQAANAAKQAGVKVYTIGMGSKGDARTPIEAKADGSYVYGWKRVLIDEPLLKEIAALTGGQYFRAQDMEQLANIYEDINRLEKSEITITQTKRYKEKYSLFVAGAFLCLMLQFILSKTVFKSIV